MPTGILMAIAAGAMNGSFATPMKRVRGWAWEHTWLVWSVVGLVIAPLAAAYATIPDVAGVYAAASAKAIALAALLGFFWGVSAILFGLGVDRVGLAIGFGIIIGISAALGALIPLFSLHAETVGTTAGVLTIGGVGLLLAGVVCCTAAGRIREAARTPAARKGSAAGLAICILSGLGAPMINFGLSFGSEIVAHAERLGARQSDSLNAIWPLLLGAGFLANAGYCVFLIARKSSWKAFRDFSPGPNLALASLMGVLWMGSNVVYAYGSRRLGPLGLTLGWPIMMGSVILTANGWGAATGEWRGAGARAKAWMLAGGLALVAGIAVIGAAAGAR